MRTICCGSEAGAGVHRTPGPTLTPPLSPQRPLSAHYNRLELLSPNRPFRRSSWGAAPIPPARLAEGPGR
jgi:hypothetical protein